MTEVGVNNGNIGQIQIADEVIATIAGTAALEVEGVAELAGNLLAKKGVSKGVKVSVNQEIAAIDVNVVVKFGYKIQDVCTAVQVKVKDAVETMTGLSVDATNIYVSGITQEK